MTQAAFPQRPAAWRPKHLFSCQLWSAYLWAPLFALKCQVRLAASLAFSTVLRQASRLWNCYTQKGIFGPCVAWRAQRADFGRRAAGAVLLVHTGGNRSLSGFLAFLPRNSEISVTAWGDEGWLELLPIFLWQLHPHCLTCLKFKWPNRAKGQNLAAPLGHGVCLCLTGAGSPLWLYFGVCRDLMLQRGILKSLGSEVLAKRSYVHWCCLCAYGTVPKYAWDWSHWHVCTQIIACLLINVCMKARFTLYTYRENRGNDKCSFSSQLCDVSFLL